MTPLEDCPPTRPRADVADETFVQDGVHGELVDVGAAALDQPRADQGDDGATAEYRDDNDERGH